MSKPQDRQMDVCMLDTHTETYTQTHKCMPAKAIKVSK